MPEHLDIRKPTQAVCHNRLSSAGNILISGAQGAGKSTLAARFATDALQNGYTVSVVDDQGMLSQRLQTWCAGADIPFRSVRANGSREQGINPLAGLDAHALSRLLHDLSRLSGENLPEAFLFYFLQLLQAAGILREPSLAVLGSISVSELIRRFAGGGTPDQRDAYRTLQSLPAFIPAMQLLLGALAAEFSGLSGTGMPAVHAACRCSVLVLPAASSRKTLECGALMWTRGIERLVGTGTQPMLLILDAVHLPHEHLQRLLAQNRAVPLAVVLVWQEAHAELYTHLDEYAQQCGHFAVFRHIGGDGCYRWSQFFGTREMMRQNLHYTQTRPRFGAGRSPRMGDGVDPTGRMRGSGSTTQRDIVPFVKPEEIAALPSGRYYYLSHSSSQPVAKTVFFD